MTTLDREILEKVKRLSPRQKEEVVNFIDFVSSRKPTRPVRSHHSEGRTEADLADLRRRLATIPGNMSDTVRELRDERG